jgi:hypothetical protein
MKEKNGWDQENNFFRSTHLLIFAELIFIPDTWKEDMVTVA